MILRKPFGILIKNFKLIHLVLTILSFYLVYRTNLLLSFFNQYMDTHNSVIGKDLTGELYNSLMYISLIIILVGTIIILGLMIFKKKKVKLYIYNIFTYLFVGAIYLFAHSTVSALEIELVDVRTLKMIQDLLTTSFMLQVISFVIVAIRATGFNVQKFEFARDLQDLEIEDIDNEEFEVNVDLNSDETKRKINRAFRHVKYIYKENKFVIMSLIVLIIGTISIAVYMNVGVYNKLYTKGQAFSTTYFTMRLGESYSSNTDYQGNELLKEETLVMIHMNIQNKTIKERTFDDARLVLNVDEHYFYHQPSYKKLMFDVGNIYINQNISTEFTDYVYIYKIPTEFLKRNIKLIYTDYNGKKIQMKIKPKSLTEPLSEETTTLNQIMSFENSVLKNIEMKIENFEVADTFRVDYNYCMLEQCYPSYEYLKPTLNGKEKKTLLKIKGIITDKTNEQNQDLYTFINNFGHLEYQIAGTTKTMKLNLNQVKPIRSSLENECYIEVLDELKAAEKIQLVFEIRNKTYRYILK